jgi:predicted NACHT family NTPase
MSKMDLNTAKDLATISAPFSTAIITAFLKPVLEDFAESFRKGKKNLAYLIANNFEEYLIRSYNKQLYIKTLVFQNRKILLNSLYIPLTVTNSDTGEGIKIDLYPRKLLPTHNKVLLVDTAGMGKSTLSRYLFLKTIEEGYGIPVFLELRQLKSDKSIIDLIHEDISKIDEVFDKEFLLKLIAKGNFIFFFDGFDEIPLKEREYATQHLQDFIAKASNNKFLLTSRQDAALASFADFQRFVINPLRQLEAFALLTRLDTINGDSSTGETAISLIDKLKQEHHNANLKSFLSNPLLVSLLYKAYDFKPTLPMRVDMFYRQVYEALFENHDLAKGGSFVRDKKSKLNIDDFSRVLRVLAIRTVGLGKVEYGLD